MCVWGQKEPSILPGSRDPLQPKQQLKIRVQILMMTQRRQCNGKACLGQVTEAWGRTANPAAEKYQWKEL